MEYLTKFFIKYKNAGIPAIKAYYDNADKNRWTEKRAKGRKRSLGIEFKYTVRHTL